MSSAQPLSPVHVVVDVANILGGMRETAPAMERTIASVRDVRLDVPAFHAFTRAGRPFGSAVWAGTERPSTAGVFDRASRLQPAVKIVTHEAGASGREVGVDALLQAHLLRLIDRPPSILVLATGDGAGWADDEGFFADAARLVRMGWEVELLSWPCVTNRFLREFAEDHGIYVPLSDYWRSLTFLTGHQRRSERLHLDRRPVANGPLPDAA